MGYIGHAYFGTLVGRHAADIGAIEMDTALGGQQGADDAAQERGLAHAVVSQNAHSFTLGDMQVNTMQHGNAAIACVELLNVEHAGSFS